MRRRRKSFGDEDAAVDMTPMLDIVFIMLIFFIVTATFLNETGLDFTRPRDNNAPSDPDPKPAIQVYISEDNNCSVDEMSTLCTDVVDRVVGQLANKPGASVILRIHEYSAHQVQISLIDGFIRRELKTKKEVITANGETR
ncbi:MAG: biopolymer transporter ExbD [Hellea sp.]|nr:biopolymer transporter ExbD [Hellea sp.]